MNQTNISCPQCGTKLKKMIYGYVQNIDDTFEPNEDVIYMGCLSFGDNRDGIYFCKSCKTKFTENLTPIKLIPCPLEASNSIFSHECRQYDLLSSKEHYTLLDDVNKICELVCPAFLKKVIVTLNSGEQIQGEITRSSKYTVDVQENHLVLYQKTGNFRGEFKSILIKEIVDIKITEN